MRFETGSSRLAVFASHTVVIANGRAGSPSLDASASTTGVSSTAVVSSDSTTVQTVASTTTRSHSSGTEPRAQRAHSRAATSNSPDASASSASTVTATRKTRIGARRTSTSPAAAGGRAPVTTTSAPPAAATLHTSGYRSETTTSSVIGRPGFGRGPGSATTPAFSHASASSSRLRGSAPSTSHCRSSRPLVALLKWLDHLAAAVRHLLQHAHRHRPVGDRRRSGFQRLAYTPERRSITRPRPAASVIADASGSRHTAASGPSDGSTESPESRYAGIRSVEPHGSEQRALHHDAARRAALGRGVERGEVERLVDHAGVDATGGSGRRGEQPASRTTSSICRSDSPSTSRAFPAGCGRGRPARRARARASPSARGTTGRRGRAAAPRRAGVLPSEGGSSTSTRRSFHPSRETDQSVASGAGSNGLISVSGGANPGAGRACGTYGARVTRRWLRAQTRQGDVLRAGFARCARGAGGAGGLPGRRPRRGRGARLRTPAAACARRRAAPRRHRHPVRHHRPRRFDRPRPGGVHRTPGQRLPGALRDRRRRVVRRVRGARSTARPTPAESRSTAPTCGRRCTRPCCPRGRRACCPASTAPRSCGASTSTPPASLSRSTSSAPLVRSRRQARLRRGAAGRSTPAPRTSRSCCCARWACSVRGSRSSAAASTCACPTRRSRHDGPGFRLAMRAPHPVEGWNAQISLLTGMSAARIMLDAGVGIVRTMPPPPHDDYERLRRTAEGLGIDWPRDVSYAELVRRPRPAPARARRVPQPRHDPAALGRLHRRRPRGRRRRPRPAAARRRGRAVRPRDRTAAPPRRPLRRRVLPRRGSGPRGAAVGARRACPRCPRRCAWPTSAPARSTAPASTSSRR